MQTRIKQIFYKEYQRNKSIQIYKAGSAAVKLHFAPDGTYRHIYDKFLFDESKNESAVRGIPKVLLWSVLPSFADAKEGRRPQTTRLFLVILVSFVTIKETRHRSGETLPNYSKTL